MIEWRHEKRSDYSLLDFYDGMELSGSVNVLSAISSVPMRVTSVLAITCCPSAKVT